MDNPLPLADFTPTEVPHCFLPNSKKQTFRPGVTKRSPFQVKTLLEVSKLPEFAYFVVLSQDEHEDVIIHESYASPIVITWVAKDGTTTIMRMNEERVVHESVLYGGEVRKLDDPVYTSRVIS